jgi:hypothetical protein
VADTVKAGINIVRSGVTVLDHRNFLEGVSLQFRNSGTGNTVAQIGLVDAGSHLRLYDRNGSERFTATTETSGAALIVSAPGRYVWLNPSSLDDESVDLPSNALSGPELLDEPGVASNNNTGTITLSGPIESLVSRTITPPSGGYILAMAGCYTQANHVTGTNSELQIGLSDVATAFGAAQDVNMRVPSGAPSGTYRFPSHMNAIFVASAGVPLTVHLVAEIVTGTTLAVGDIALSLLYVPTAYGSVSPALTEMGGMEDAPSSAPSLAKIAAERTDSEAFARRREETELADMKGRLAELEARMASME